MDEIDEEIEFHVAEMRRALRRQGWTDADAQAEAERRFGDRRSYRRNLIRMNRYRWRPAMFALRWKNLDLEQRYLTVCEAVYEGHFGTPKTQAGIRQVPLSDSSVCLIADWKQHARTTDAESLVFATWSGKPISPNNVLRRWVIPAAAELGLPKVSWLTFRRTYSSWAHEKGVPGKVIASLMGHAKVDTTLNIYTQVLDDSLRAAADKVGRELFTIVHKPDEPSALTH
jgi:integrase